MNWLNCQELFCCIFTTTTFVSNNGVRDRNRTCIKWICNPRPNRSATHAHKSGTLAQIRTERTAPFERADFTNLSNGAYLKVMRLKIALRTRPAETKCSSIIWPARPYAVVPIS